MTCPRCAGFVKSNRDRYGAYRECFACGWLEPIDSYDPTNTPQSPQATYSNLPHRKRLRRPRHGKIRL